MLIGTQLQEQYPPNPWIKIHGYKRTEPTAL